MVEKRNLNILWYSNWHRQPTGYGNQSNLFLPFLLEHYTHVVEFANYGVVGTPIMDTIGNKQILVLPTVHDTWGNDIAKGHYKFAKADLIITLCDPFVLDEKVYKDFNWCSWVPVDSSPVFYQTLEAIEHAKWIWAMTQWGAQELIKAGVSVKDISYVPHGVDTNVFKPGDKREAKEKFGKLIGKDLSSKYLVVWNAANKDAYRKGFFEGLRAFKMFASKNKNALLYFHTDSLGIQNDYDLYRILKEENISYEQVVFASSYHYLSGMISDEYLALAYQAGDVLLHPSLAGGFEIPILEAAACGLPAITGNWGAMAEINACGFRVSCEPRMYKQGTIWKAPVISELEKALELSQNGLTDKEHKKLLQFAKGYDAKKVWSDHMLPALKKIEGL